LNKLVDIELPPRVRTSGVEHRSIVVETIGSVSWLAMDAAWLFAWNTLAAGLAVPCVVANLLLFRYTKTSKAGMAVTASMNGWLLMNVAWMLGDVWEKPNLLVAAKVFCALATFLLFVAFSTSKWRLEAAVVLFAGFRRLRFAFQERPKQKR